MAYRKIAFLLGFILLGQTAGSAATDVASDAVACIGTKSIDDTIGIVANRTTGAREQSLVQARLAIVARNQVVGTFYVDDEGLRYVEPKAGVNIPDLPKIRSHNKIYLLPMQQTFDGEARLRTCRNVPR